MKGGCALIIGKVGTLEVQCARRRKRKRKRKTVMAATELNLT